MSYLSNTIVELGHSIIFNSKETLSSSLLCHFVLEIPDPVPMRELFMSGSAFGQDTALEARHGEQEVGVVLGVDGHEA